MMQNERYWLSPPDNSRERNLFSGCRMPAALSSFVHENNRFAPFRAKNRQFALLRVAHKLQRYPQQIRFLGGLKQCASKDFPGHLRFRWCFTSLLCSQSGFIITLAGTTGTCLSTRWVPAILIVWYLLV